MKDIYEAPKSNLSDSPMTWRSVAAEVVIFVIVAVLTIFICSRVVSPINALFTYLTRLIINADYWSVRIYWDLIDTSLALYIGSYIVGKKLTLLPFYFLASIGVLNSTFYIFDVGVDSILDPTNQFPLWYEMVLVFATPLAAVYGAKLGIKASRAQ